MEIFVLRLQVIEISYLFQYTKLAVNLFFN